MFARIVALALLFSIVGGGFVFGADASRDRKDAEPSSIEAGPLRLESDSSANLWEFIRNSAADDDGNISVKPLLRTFLSWRAQLATPTLIEEHLHSRPSGLVLLCERALQLRSGVLKA